MPAAYKVKHPPPLTCVNPQHQVGHFDAGLPLDFNVHCHVDKAVAFPVKLSAVSNAGDTLDTRIEQDYCWMWSNKSAAPATFTVRLQR